MGELAGYLERHMRRHKVLFPACCKSRRGRSLTGKTPVSFHVTALRNSVTFIRQPWKLDPLAELPRSGITDLRQR